MQNKTQATLLQTEALSIKVADKIIGDSFNMTLFPGEMCAILGKNGVGKTTLLHTLAGLRPANAGHVLLQQQNLAQLSRRHIAQQLGILLQQSQDTFPSSVLETALHGRAPHYTLFGKASPNDLAITRRALALVQLDHIEQQCVTTLSGGERRRLAIAMLLAQTPKLYLLDEPTAHLDIDQQIRLLNHFKLLAKQQNVGIIMVLHDVNLALRYCDKVLMLFDHQHHEFGDIQTLVTAQNLQALYRHSFELITAGEHCFWIASIHS